MRNSSLHDESTIHADLVNSASCTSQQFLEEWRIGNYPSWCMSPTSSWSMFFLFFLRHCGIVARVSACRTDATGISATATVWWY